MRPYFKLILLVRICINPFIIHHVRSQKYSEQESRPQAAGAGEGVQTLPLYVNCSTIKNRMTSLYSLGNMEVGDIIRRIANNVRYGELELKRDMCYFYGRDR